MTLLFFKNVLLRYYGNNIPVVWYYALRGTADNAEEG